MMNPFFGSSTNVWALVISSFIVAYALGNLIGGYKFDKRIVLLILSLFYFSIYLIGFKLLFYLSYNTSFYTGLLTSVFIYCFIPTFLISLLTPVIASRINKESSKSVPMTNYLLGLGNLAGILITVFLLLPNFELVTIIMSWFFLSLLWSYLYIKPMKLVYKISYLLSLLCLTVPSFGSHLPINYKFSKFTEYGWVGVVDNGNERMLLTSFAGAVSPQSLMYKDNINQPIGYIAYAFNAMKYKPNPEKVLHIGLGGGSFNKAFYNVYPNSLLTSVEINPIMQDIARDYFYYDSDNYKTHNVVISDARRFLRSNKNLYDWIFIDAFNADKIPFHLATIEFYDLVKSRLSPDGVVIINLLTNHELYSNYLSTIQFIFPYVFIEEIADEQVLVFASKKAVFEAPSISFSESFLTDYKFIP